MATLTKTKTPGIFRRHRSGCDGAGRCECSYVVVWRHRGGQHKATFRTFAEAREAQGKRAAGDARPTSRTTFAAYFDDWIETFAGRTSRGFSETSRDLYRRAITDMALPTWRTWRMAEIEPADVRALFADLSAKGRSRSTLRTLRSAVSAMYATALEDGLVAVNPIRGVRLPAAENLASEDKRAKALTRAELRLVLAALPEDGYWRLFFEFLAVTGLRISEAVGLRWEHLDLSPEGGTVAVREQVYRGKRKRLKTNAGRREVPISGAIATRLLEHRRDNYGGPQAPVFANSTDTEIDPHNVRRTVLQRVAVELGHFEMVEGDDGKTRKRTTLGFHAFRHTCASMLFAEGRNIKQVQTWLGHATPSVTLETYVHLLDEGVGDALDFDAQGNRKATGGLQAPANTGGLEVAETA